MPLEEGILLQKDGVCVRLSQAAADIEASLQLRQKAFRPGDPDIHADRDQFDGTGLVLAAEIEGANAEKTLLATMRVWLHVSADSFQRGYMGQYFRIGLGDVDFPILEIGRLALENEVVGPAGYRAITLGVMRLISVSDAHLVAGCASLPGSSVEDQEGVLASLRSSLIHDRKIGVAAKRYDSINIHSVTKNCTPQPLTNLIQLYVLAGARFAPLAVCDTDLDRLVLCATLDTKRPSGAIARQML